jgi:hypothetical protein
MGKGKLATALRCTGLALLVLGAFALLPAAAQAQCTGPHGVSIFKQCESPVNRCGVDADCADTDQCNGIEECATEGDPGSNVVTCIISLTNPANHCDNITLLEAADAVTNATGPGSTSTSILITGTATGVVSGTCTAGTDLGGATTCTIAPGGNVDFIANYYTAVPTDPGTLNDQATINVQDTCSGSPTGCSTTPNMVQFTASTTTVSGCTPGTPLTCADDLFCTDDSCDPATGCVFAPHPCADDTLFCNGPETCDEATDACVSGPAVVCPDTDLCDGPNACDEATDTCIAQGPPVDCTDAFFCSTESCDPATGQCVAGDIDNLCDDADICTDDTCDEAADACVNTPDPTNDPSCVPGEEICRTPGFFGTHGGEAKTGSQNITQEILDTFGGTLEICGRIIDNTDVGNVNSALEAICVSPKGDSRLQLARQLTSAALNCALSTNTDTDVCTASADGAAPCTDVSINDIFEACNDACAAGETTALVGTETVSCIGAIDCFNNGGSFGFDADGNPAPGECGCEFGTDPNTGLCVNNCHSADLVNGCFNFVPPGPAGSAQLCNEARKNDVIILLP